MPPWTGSYRRRRPQARRATAVTIFSAAAAATARAAARDGAALVVLAARPRQAGQRCPDTARSVQKVEARTGAVVSEDVLWPTRRASVAAAPVAVCSIEEEHTWLYGEILCCGFRNASNAAAVHCRRGICSFASDLCDSLWLAGLVASVLGR
jgi:hypothetical protein